MLVVYLFVVGVLSTGALLSSLGDLVQDELRDGVREGRSHGEEVTLGLVAVLVGDELQRDKSTVGGGVPGGETLMVRGRKNT